MEKDKFIYIYIYEYDIAINALLSQCTAVVAVQVPRK